MKTRTCWGVPRVIFEESELGARTSLDVEGGALVDACDDAHAPVGFSCRSASCGTCLVEILEGLDLLEPMSPEERDVLEILYSPSHHRLACQAKIKRAPGIVRLRWVKD